MLKKNLNFIKYLPAIAVFVIGLNCITPLWSELTQRLHGSIRTAGYVVGIYAFTYAVANLVWAFIITRVKHYKFWILSSFLLAGVGFLFYIKITNLTDLYVLQFFLGTISSMQSPAFDSYYSQSIEAEFAPLAWGSYATIFNLAVGIGGLIGSHIVHYYGFELMFTFMAGLEFFSFIIGIFTL